MSAVSWSRLLLGGLLAGLIILISGLVLAHLVLGPVYVTAFLSHMPYGASAWTLVAHTGLRLLLGLVAVFIYVGFRPRFGPGPRTALIAAATLFLSVYLPMAFLLYDFGILSGWRLAVAWPWGLAEIACATLAGAWLYREPGSDAG